MYLIAKIHVSVYRTSLQLQIDDYINSTSIQQFFPPTLLEKPAYNQQYLVQAPSHEDF